MFSISIVIVAFVICFNRGPYYAFARINQGNNNYGLISSALPSAFSVSKSAYHFKNSKMALFSALGGIPNAVKLNKTGCYINNKNKTCVCDCPTVTKSPKEVSANESVFSVLKSYNVNFKPIPSLKEVTKTIKINQQREKSNPNYRLRGSYMLYVTVHGQPVVGLPIL
jgi:hypothetical protein